MKPRPEGRLESRPRSPRSRDLIDVDRRGEPFHGDRPERRDLDQAFDEAERVGGRENRSRDCKLFHARGEMSGRPDRAVVYVQIGADRAHHDLSGIEPDADLDGDALAPPYILGEVADLLLHAQRGIGGAHGMVFMSQRRAEQGHDAVAQHLIHRSLVVMDRVHHVLDHRVEEPPGLLGILIGQELER